MCPGLFIRWVCRTLPESSGILRNLHPKISRFLRIPAESDRNVWGRVKYWVFYLPFMLSLWSSLSCLGHVVNFGNVDIMERIMKIMVVKNATAIWEYDPSREDNHVLGGSLDVIAAIRTLAIKVSMFSTSLSWHIPHIQLDPGLGTMYRILSEYSDSM